MSEATPAGDPRPGFDVPRDAQPERSLTPSRVTRLRRLTIILAVISVASAFAGQQDLGEGFLAALPGVVVPLVVYSLIWVLLGSQKPKVAERARTLGSVYAVLGVAAVLVLAIVAFAGMLPGAMTQLVVAIGIAIVSALWLFTAWRRLPGAPANLLDDAR